MTGSDDSGPRHRHLDAVALPDGTTVWACSFPVDGYQRERPPDFGLYLDARWQPPWPHSHIEWPDFGLPADQDALVNSLAALLARARRGENVEVGCLGGHGRTGTAIACLAALTGVAQDPVEWVRAGYCAQAVETDDQAELARRFSHRE
ncbi:MAG: protein-tyrosine phosphatase family protein [Acidimicrobiales bacterium]